MSHDTEGRVRALLHAADHQPGLLDPQRVIAAGRRRVRRRRIAPVAAVAALVLLGTGVTVRELQRPGTAAQTVALSPGGWQRLDVEATVLEFAVLRVPGTSNTYLSVSKPDTNGGRVEVIRVPDVDGPGPLIGVFSSQYPTLQFAVFPAGTREITPVFTGTVPHSTATTTVRGVDLHDYVVVVVSTESYDDGTRLRGFTWRDTQGEPHQDLPLPG